MVRLALILAAAGALLTPAVAAAPPSLIVYARMADDHHETFSVRPDGSGMWRLSGRTHETEPAISPDGRLIAAVGGPGIVVRTRAGKLVRQIRLRAGSQLTDPSWSPGGRWISVLAERCQSDGGGDPSPLCADLWLLRRDGRLRRRLVESNVHTNDLIAAYSWSPAGRSIVFERFEGSGLAIVDVRSGKIRTLRGTLRFGSGDPAWSRFGWIAFARQRGPFRGSDVYAVRPDGTRLHRVTRARSAMRPVWSPDGLELAFLDFATTEASNRSYVTLVRADGSRRRRVGQATAEWTLAWSPDGKSLVWEMETERLVVGSADGRGRPRVVARGTGADWG